MKLQLFKTLWGHQGSLLQAIQQASDAGMQGIEGPAPTSPEQQEILLEALAEHNLLYIAEITTAGTYVPERHASLDEHLASLERKLVLSRPLNPLFITCLGGCDAWPEDQSLEFFELAMEMAMSFELPISFETHRSRSLFNPWITQRVVETIPNIRLTADFSHWCVVCERLMDTELDVIEAIAPNVHHVHARVGYEQGPQVPHPAAPEYEYALRAHQGWWEMIWREQIRAGFGFTTMTPEFGPDGYLHEAPFTREAVGDLWEMNVWMGEEERRHFLEFSSDLDQ